MYFGVQYYPEHWPEARWRVDIEMMKRAGVNTVRMGEFAWSALEPEEGHYTFEWLDRVLALLNENGIKTIMCTMSRTPPPWAFRKYPGIVNIRQDGHVNRYGQRYTVGLGHPEFVELSQRIDGKVIEHFAGNDAIVGWQIDNEVGGYNDCFCDRCLAQFRMYLRRRYGAVENLNEKWGANFWSFRFSDFDEVPLPENQPQLALAYRRFMSEQNIAFARWRAEKIRALDPDKWITTNFQSFGASHTDYARLAPLLDYNGMNHYPPRSPELILDLYRYGGKPTLALEQCTRLANKDIGKGWMRLWAYQAIAHGIQGINFFRWRCCRWGQEQFGDGILPHGGHENRRYRELVRMGMEIQHIGDLIDGTHPEAKVAVLHSYESRWTFTGARGLPSDMNPVDDAVRYHQGLMRENIMTDALDPRGDLSPYRLVIAPRLFCVDAVIASNLRKFVQEGGILCLTAASGVVDEYGVSFAHPRPGLLANIAGVQVSDLAPLKDLVKLASAALPTIDGLNGRIMADEIYPTSAKVLARFDSGWRKGLPAITENPVGKGRVIYVGTVLEDEALDVLLAYLCQLARIAGIMQTPEGVTAYERCGDQKRLLFLLNYTETPKIVAFAESWQDAFSGEITQKIEIPPVDLRILQRSD